MTTRKGNMSDSLWDIHHRSSDHALAPTAAVEIIMIPAIAPVETEVIKIEVIRISYLEINIDRD